jgi:hypothetical protein
MLVITGIQLLFGIGYHLLVTPWNWSIKEM